MRIFFSAAFLFAGLIGANAASVRPNVQVASELVTLGDLVEDAGAMAATAVFRAPDLGQSGVISADRVVEAAARYGLEARADGVSTVTVTRQSRMIDASQIEMTVRRALAAKGLMEGDMEAEIRISGLATPIHLPVTAGIPEIISLDHSASDGGFIAHVAVKADSGSIPLFSTRAQGRITRFEEIPVLTRRIDRYEIIGPDDVTVKRVEQTRGAHPVTSLAAIVGKSAKRAMRPGAAVTAQDVTAPIVVRRNETVTMLVRTGRLLLSARGRALADGAAGDIVPVINMASRRTVEGTVTPSGTIEIAPRPSTISVADASLN